MDHESPAPQQWRVRCPCGHEFTVSRGRADASITCPACQRELAVPANPAAAGKEPCPHCRELIHPQATKCPFCQEYLGGHGGQAAAGRSRTSGMAIASLVLGIVAPTMCFATGLPAAILGIGGVLATRGGKTEGRGMAVAGLLLGIVWTLVLAGIVVLFIAAASLRGTMDVTPLSPPEPLF